MDRTHIHCHISPHLILSILLVASYLLHFVAFQKGFATKKSSLFTFSPFQFSHLGKWQMAQQKTFGTARIKSCSHAPEHGITLLVCLDTLLHQIRLILLLAEHFQRCKDVHGASWGMLVQLIYEGSYVRGDRCRI